MIKLDRKKLFKIHSWIGIKLSVLFFVVCFSGTLATLSHEMDWLFIPESRAYSSEATPQAALVPHNQIAANIHTAFPDGKIVYWITPEEPYLCNIIHLVQDGQRHFTVLVFGFMLLISLLTALFFYKKWYRKLFELKTGKGAIVFFRSLHRLVGVWSVPFTILFSVTGIWYFVERVNVGGVSTIANTQAPQLSEPIADSAAFAEIQRTFDINQAVKVAQLEIEGLVVKDILPPARPTSALYLTGKSDEPLVRNRANRVYLHPTTFEVLKVQRASSLPTVTWLNDIADPLHFGNWGGLITKIIWFLLGLGISSLVLTGIFWLFI